MTANKTSTRFLYALLAIVALLTVAFFGLRWFEYAVTFHPVAFTANKAWSLPEGGEDVSLTTQDGVNLHAWFVHSNSKPSAATIIFFHGNSGNLSNIGWLGTSLAQRGFDVLLVDYRGFGRSEGKLGDEEDIYADGDAAYNYITRDRSVVSDEVVLYGQSLGTVVAADLASRRPAGALILESGLSSASNMARYIVPWLPTSLHWLSRYRFESERKLALVNCPVLITHGDPDDTIPTDEGRKLFAAAREPKKLLLVPGANHNVLGSGGEKYLNEIAAFIRASVAKQKLKN